MDLQGGLSQGYYPARGRGRAIRNNMSKLTSYKLPDQTELSKTPTELPPSLSQYMLPDMHDIKSMNDECILPVATKTQVIDQNNNKTDYNIFNKYKLNKSPTIQKIQKKKSWNTFQSNDDDDDDSCPICDRSDKHVLCKICGHSWKGRRRIRCEKHPSTVMLMDSNNCPQCHSTELKEV